MFSFETDSELDLLLSWRCRSVGPPLRTSDEDSLSLSGAQTNSRHFTKRTRPTFTVQLQTRRFPNYSDYECLMLLKAEYLLMKQFTVEV